MPQLDVSSVLFDPMFADQLTCLRQTETVGTDGMNNPTDARIPFSGVVTSNAGDVLDVIAEGTRVKGSITVHTVFRLRMSGDGIDADHVLYNGVEYIVDNINDYSRYGAGFIAADCIIKPVTG